MRVSFAQLFFLPRGHSLAACDGLGHGPEDANKLKDMSRAALLLLAQRPHLAAAARAVPSIAPAVERSALLPLCSFTPSATAAAGASETFRSASASV